MGLSNFRHHFARSGIGLLNLFIAASALSGTPKEPGALLARASQRPELALVLNSADASISVLDIRTYAELHRIPALREPHHMALTPDHQFLLVGDTSGNTLLFLDPTTGEVRKRAIMSDPYQLVFSPDGKWLTVAGLARNQIDIYDWPGIKLIHRIRALTMPSHINYSPDSRVVYVSLQGTNSVIALDVKDGNIIWRKIVGNTPAGVLWHDGKLLVGIMGEDYVAVVNPGDGRVERKIHTGRGAHVLFTPHDGSAIYVSNRVDGSITILDPKSLDPIRTFQIPWGPDDMDFAPDGKIWISEASVIALQSSTQLPVSLKALRSAAHLTESA
jgi:DNA-binding beta-propeller fold protein YncE